MENGFTVLIVGGSVAGLSLAHCLEQLGVSYIILEKGDRIAPQLGASIGILPNGARILDQLGIFEHVEDEIEPLELARIRFPDDFWFESRYPQTLHSNYGYPLSFLERQKFVQILHDKLKRKDCVFTSKRVTLVEDGKTKALVKTSDGSEYSADIVVGADGVHSVVRSAVFRHLKAAFKVADGEKQDTGIKYDFSCVYGISFKVPHVELGVQMSRLDDDVSIHAFTGKKSKLFWFVMIKSMPDDYDEKGNCSEERAKLVCESLSGKKINDCLTFGDIWSRCTVSKMTPLQEGVFKRWNCGRLVCIGDAVRKMAPNIGQGANMAIEDAARLANLLSDRIKVGNLSHRAVDSMLHDFAAAQKPRTDSICSQSEFLVRMHANQGLGRRVLGRYMIPFLKDAPAGLSGLSVNGAAKLEYKDLPARSLDGAWDLSFASILRSLSCLSPKMNVPGYALILAVAAIIVPLVRYRL